MKLGLGPELTFERFIDELLVESSSGNLEPGEEDDDEEGKGNSQPLSLLIEVFGFVEVDVDVDPGRPSFRILACEVAFRLPLFAESCEPLSSFDSRLMYLFLA